MTHDKKDSSMKSNLINMFRVFRNQLFSALLDVLGIFERLCQTVKKTQKTLVITRLHCINNIMLMLWQYHYKNPMIQMCLNTFLFKYFFQFDLYMGRFFDYPFSLIFALMSNKGFLKEVMKYKNIF